VSGTTLEQFAQEVAASVVAGSEAEAVSTHDAFAELVLADLESAGHIDDSNIAYFRSHGVEVSGFGRNEPTGTLDLFHVRFRQEPLLQKVGSTELATYGKRVVNYAAKARAGLQDQIEGALEAYDMAGAVQEALRDGAEALRVFLITNDVSTVTSLPSSELDGRPVSFEVWDLRRLHRLASSGVLHEPIAVDFDPPLPCLSTPETDENYSVFLSIVPGKELGRIYREYGSRLLQLNVRSFLQLRGKVNKGIRETLLNAPERFLAYNNGISATASKVEFSRTDTGALAMSRIVDLQVVNGGQTTASIHSAMTKDGVDLSNVFVQMKLTVVDPSHLDEVVPEISRFSNTQNKVTVVDFSSNNPYFVGLEKVTRTLWAPAVRNTGQETKWFFERARGQYADELSKARTPAKQRAFKLQHPSRQKFTKTDVAKWVNSWNQQPWLVSRGAEKNFQAFVASLSDVKESEDVRSVQRLLALGILFRETERIVTAQQFGGYRANIVTYTIAKLSHATAQRLDLEGIWREQGLSDALAEAVEDACRIVQPLVMEPPRGYTHIGEWTKKEALWSRVREAEWSPSLALGRELLDSSRARAGRVADQHASMSDSDTEAVHAVESVSADDWFALSAWARETGNLQSWQRSLAYSIGRLRGRGAAPSVKQARQGVKILAEAQRLGFRCSAAMPA
jgi:hypothetical protein